MAESSNDLIESVAGFVQAQLTDVNTCMPGTVVSYENGIATVQPAGNKQYADGETLPFPIIPHVRVCWPSFAGGKAGVKGPIQAGDKCLIVFAQQATDGSTDLRMFDLSDAYIIPCDLGSVGEGDSENNADMTMYFGAASIRITAGGEVNITAPGGHNISAPTTKIDSEQTTITGETLQEGLLSYQDGMRGLPGGNGSTFEGDLIQTNGILSSNGVQLDTHTHSGVQSGGDSTGGPT